ncbi:uncharacterized protein LOC126870410 [Bombus huntii]|uniref:uncharacterized protein LOC126870410 n=1 Tax=Bombus huntii TaxID=85661 RepID=UPI0021AA6E99|nr:uncharacterized protein LOC126870410 [Bombus huntii]
MLTLINKEAPDMVLISETKLNKRHNVHFKNYSMIRHDKPNTSQGGGTAILIKNPIKYKTILIDKITSFKTLETTIIKIKISNKENLFITAAYATYGNQKEFNYEFNNLFELLQLNKPENYYIIAGDLNAKHTSWKNEINNTRGNFIRNWLDNKSIHYKTNLYSSELPSYPKGGSYLDICLANVRLKFQNLPPNNTLKTLAYDSDHNALVFHVNKNTSDFLTLKTQTETPREELEFLKYLLYRIKAQLKQEFANSINHYWTNKIKNISKNNSANMFPQINQIFRPKEQNPIPPLKLPSENASLIQEAGLIYKLIKKNFPKYLIKIVWDMITSRTFVITEGSHSSSKEFSIKNGLQQAFADDLVIYVTGRKTKTIKTELQELFEKINDYYHAWKLKINISKCETILFRPKSSEIGPIEREYCKKSELREKTDKGALIPQQKLCKIPRRDTLEGTEILEHRIITTHDIPINIKQYRYPPAHREEINRQIQELLDTDVVEPSTSPYNSPLWIVPKKPNSQGNKRCRLVIDYRKLNDKTIGDCYIGEDGIKPDPKKIKAVSKFPRPKKANTIKQFLGLVGYYRRFIPNFSEIAKPLTQLLKKDIAFK